MIQAAFVCLFICFGSDDKPVVVSDFCQIAGPQIQKLKSPTPAELAALSRPRKEAIRNLRQDYKRLCST